MRHVASILVVPFALAVMSGNVQAQQQAPPDCSAPEFRQFDFWVGDWTVTNPQGQTAGTNRITRILKNCVLLEEWTGATGSSGKSFNTWSRQDGQWHQTWVSDTGALLLLAGGLKDRSMVMEGTTKAPDGSTVHNRITWSTINGNADRVRQHWEQSRDAGGTWTTAFDGTYVRRGR